MKRKAIALIRVSTDHQDTMRQHVDVESVARRFDLEIMRKVELGGVSGTKTNESQEVQDILAELASNPNVDGVIASHIDRVVRVNLPGDLRIFDPFQIHKKRLWTVTHGEIDFSSDIGFMAVLFGGGQAGLELRELKRRTIGARERKRQQGDRAGGRIPRGIRFQKGNHTTKGQWSYAEPEFSRVKRAYELLFDGLNYTQTANRVGGGWTHETVHDTLRNPIWKGMRVYPAGAMREVPLEVRIDIEPLLTSERWQQAQEIMLRLKKGGAKPGSVSRALLGKLLYCTCGHLFYIRSEKRREWDSYFCTSKRYAGVSCGAHPSRQIRTDQTAELLINQYLLSERVLHTIFTELLESQEALRENTDRENMEQELAELEQQRQRLIDIHIIGKITRDDFIPRHSKLEHRIASLRKALPPPASAYGWKPRRLAQAVVARARKFPKLSHKEKHVFLHTAVERFILDSQKGFLSMTLKGGFLNAAVDVNESYSRITPFNIDNPNPYNFKDLEIRFPQPVQVVQ
jgi:DNA invertase Pin-like site-specific DNA recombinase